MGSHKRLKINEEHSCSVKARERSNNTGLMVEKGDVYSFSVDPDDKWVDLIKLTDADGFPSPFFLRRSERRLPLPNENWFKLIGRVGKSVFPIGIAPPNITISETGILYCLANDYVFWNNFGKVKLKIIRIQ